MSTVDGTSELGWLRKGSTKEVWTTGVQAIGFASRVRILHSMWEHPSGAEGAPSYDQVEKASPSEESDEAIRKILEGAVATGVGLGPDFKPNGWDRLPWRTLAERWRVALDLGHVDPLASFSDHLRDGSWPVSIHPPTEGSLDWDSLEHLVAVVRRHTSSPKLYRMSTWQIWLDDPFPNAIWHGTPDELLSAYEEYGSGANWWPEDHSWLVYTDYDLTTTIVQGSDGLISELTNDPYLETVELEPFRTDIEWPNI
ncbi:MAG: hypothetical protein GY720_03960 [bacterium]|nr:hypothetical protein [bacterium]